MTADPRLPGPGEQDRFKDALVREALVLGRRIADGDDAGIVQRETTITETTLLNLRQVLGERLQITTLTQDEEGKQGADWIWCVGGPGGWFSFWVQAKKLKSGVYDIGYTSKTGRLQVDTLINAATFAGVVPVHVLFNPSRPGVQYSTRPCAAYYDVGADSFTVVPSIAARAILHAGRRLKVRLEDMAAHAHPWACMAGCPHDRRYGGDTLPHGGPWGYLLRDTLPSQFERDSAAGQLARLITRQTLESLRGVTRDALLSDDDVAGQWRLARDLARGAFTREAPSWADSPRRALEELAEVALSSDGVLPVPTAVVVLRIGDREAL
ncbi:hypothetical protein [Cellulosimicrobium funkei]